MTILCITSYEKGADFMRTAKSLGVRVIVVTSLSLKDSSYFNPELYDELFYMPDVNKEWNMQEMINAVSHLGRTEYFDRIVALDDYDIEKAALLREHLRIPGMGETTARYFRDKLAMRMRAREEGILVPDFVHALNYIKIKEFTQGNKFPYMLKPRLNAGASGIKKVKSEDQLWEKLSTLGDMQSYYLLEQFIEGDIYHVDSVIKKGEIIYAVCSKYAKPPFEVAHEGRVFCSTLIEKNTEEENNLIDANEKVLKAMGMKKGVSHTEFIRAKEDGRFYFLETSARVGGANLHEMIYAATGINMWVEWAKLELGNEEEYQIPETLNKYSAILTSLAKQTYPDMSRYNDAEIVWRLNKKHHAGLVIASENYGRIQELIETYTNRFYNDFFTSAPMPDKPSD